MFKNNNEVSYSGKEIGALFGAASILTMFIYSFIF